MRDTTTERIIECIIKVHQIMGPGFLENLYRRALLIEMEKTGLTADTEKEVTIYYSGVVIWNPSTRPSSRKERDSRVENCG